MIDKKVNTLVDSCPGWLDITDPFVVYSEYRTWGTTETKVPFESIF